MSKIASQLAAMCCPQLCEHFYSVLCSETNGGLAWSKSARISTCGTVWGCTGNSQRYLKIYLLNSEVNKEGKSLK